MLHSPVWPEVPQYELGSQVSSRDDQGAGMCPLVPGVAPLLSGARGTQQPGITSIQGAAAEMKVSVGNCSLICKFNLESPLRKKA